MIMCHVMLLHCSLCIRAPIICLPMWRMLFSSVLSSLCADCPLTNERREMGKARSGRTDHWFACSAILCQWAQRAVCGAAAHLPLSVSATGRQSRATRGEEAGEGEREKKLALPPANS